MAARVPEEQPVLPVQVGVAAEHLLVHVLAFRLEALREAGRLAEPVVGVGLQLCGRGERGRAGEGVGGEDGVVLDLARDPGLDVLDVGGSWKVDGIAVCIDPGVGGARRGMISIAKAMWRSVEL